ncbi:MAG: small multi-drug export protein [Candidatus Caldatribacterium sp.]|nr:small multi-drug export protein [Candidatus Caldatribacterium sp.]
MSFSGILRVALFAMLPVSEVRGALPYGVFVERLPLPLVLLVALLANIAPFFLVMYFVPPLVQLLQGIPWFRRLWTWYTEKAQKRFLSYKKYGKWGILLFVGVPLPFTGVWTGTLIAFLAGFRPWEVFPFALGGLAMATGIVTLLVLFGRGV